jgi:hypothetical protein
MTTRRPREKDEFLGRYGRHSKFGGYWTLPGHEGPRPRLNLVLEILAGRAQAIIEALLPFELQVRSFPDTLGEVLSRPDSVLLTESRMISMMRTLAELWIASGKDAANNGVDTPSQRNVLFARSEDSPSIHDYLARRLFDRHPRFMQITVRGKLGVSDTFPRIMPHPLTHTFDMTSLEDWGERLALYFFAQLLDSPYSLHLSRCDDCGEYFAYERARQVAVKNGVHCNRCKLSDSIKRTRDRRRAFDQKLIDSAAKARMRWKKSHRNPNQDEWVLEKVNAEFASVLKTPKTKRWLTTHRDTILQAETEKRTNAKG